MGARNSTPQTVRIENNQQSLPIHVTPSVVTRLEDARQALKQNREDPDTSTPITSNECDQCLEHQQQLENLQAELQKQVEELKKLRQEHYETKQSQPYEEDFEKRFQEKEEQQFEKALNRVGELLNHSPSDYQNQANGQIISEMKEQLIQCYKKNTGRSLHCAEIAKQFQQTVMREQLHSMLKYFESTPPPTPPPTPISE